MLYQSHFYLYFALDVLKTVAQEEENKVQDTLLLHHSMLSFFWFIFYEGKNSMVHFHAQDILQLCYV
jgi:hypothetical protein